MLPPEAGSVLRWVDTVTLDIRGQGIAWDRSAGEPTLYGIVRGEGDEDNQVTVHRIPLREQRRSRTLTAHSTHKPRLLCQSSIDCSFVEALVIRSDPGHDPARLEPSIRCTRVADRQLAVDRRSEGVKQLGPGRVEQPKSARTAGAEMALPGAGLQPANAVRVGLPDLGAVDAKRLAPVYLERVRDGREIYGVSTAARRLAADRAVAELVGLRRLRSQ